MTFKIKKPDGTFYTDYVIQNSKCIAIFEHGVRVTHKFVCRTEKQKVDNITETDLHLIITI